jgi:tRNA(Ile)-lysidine synthase
MLTQYLESFFKQFINTKTIYVGYSGGLDSTVLLFALSQTVYKSQLKAIHVHHGLSSHADSWSKHCQNFCDHLQIPLQVEKIKLIKSGQSVEAEARTGRYALFKNMLQKDDLICTAHHRDDQAETLLLQLFRGSGVKGLSAMPAIKHFGMGYLIRALLNYSRQDLLDYANEHQLSWIDDESNEDTRFDRNFIRHEVMPLIKKRWDAIEKVLARSTMHFAETQQLLDKIGAEHYAQLKGSQPNTLSISKLLTLEKSVRRNLIRFWINQNNFPLPSQKKLNQIENEILLARVDAEPIVHWQSVEVRRYRDNLYVMAAVLPFNSSFMMEWKGEEDLLLPNNLGLISKTVLQNLKLNGKQKLYVRFRQGGETLYLPNRGHRSLKKLMQEWGIPPWQRGCIPLIFLDEQLIIVYDKFKLNLAQLTR